MGMERSLALECRLGLGLRGLLWLGLEQLGLGLEPTLGLGRLL